MNNLLTEWKIASKELGLDLIENPIITFKDGRKISPILILRNFGAINGMIIVINYDLVADYLDEIEMMGYGFSTLNEPEYPNFERDSFIEMLRDWGWTGKDSPPLWY